MEVSHVIKELLYNHNCVIVPGFGAFIANEVSTRVHPITNTFSPPSKSIAFNRSLVKNDGLLIKEFALHYAISDKESEQKIKTFAAELETRIQSEKIVRIEEVGTFQVDGEGNIQFKADDSVNFLDDSFGLPDLYIKPIKKELDMTQQPLTPRRAPIRNKPTEEKKVEKLEEEASNKKIFLIIPIALILLGIGSLFLVENGEGDPYMAALFPALKTESPILEEETEVDEHETMDEDSSDEVITEVSHRYYIIAGVFSEKENADRLLESTASGEILNIGGYYKVSLSEFDSEADAEAELHNYTSEFGNDIWVLEK